MQVAIRQLKAELSKFIAFAQDGEEIEVTSHNHPVARIIGIPKESSTPLKQMISTGVAQWHGGKPQWSTPLKLSNRGTIVSQMILDDRG